MEIVNSVTCGGTSSQVSLRNDENEKSGSVDSSETSIKREIEEIILDSDDEFTDNKVDIGMGFSAGKKYLALLQREETYKCLKDSDLTLLTEKEESSDKETDLDTSRERYPKRKTARKRYEDGVFNEDDFIFCDDCQIEYEGDCPFHGPLFLAHNKKIPQGMYADRALYTLPWFLSLSNSSNKDARLGVWTEVELPKNIVFGPYEGVVVQNDDAQKTEFAWQIRRSGKVLHYVDGSNRSFSNWLRYVNYGDKKEHQNLIAFQYKEKIYYRTCKEIKPHTELLICYNNRYCGRLGKDPPKETDQEEPQADSETKSYECDFCFKLFDYEKLLVRHRKAHHHMKPRLSHKCHQDSYSTSVSTSLRQQLSNEKKHECPECGKTFTRKYSIKAHLLIHQSETPFECVVCPKKFREKRTLNRHLKSHTGQAKLWSCATCNKGFYGSHHLKRHQLIHSEQKPYKCQHCAYRSNRSDSIRRHIKRVHTKK